MHCHLEIIMPPTEDVEGAVKQIMAPFNEQGSIDCEDDDMSSFRFWDWWVVGGRWSGLKVDSKDICTLDKIPDDLHAAAVIIAGPNHKGDGFEALYMVHGDMWNGVTHIKTAWDGTVAWAIAEHVKRMEGYKEYYKVKATPAPDWLAVTVDYHN